SASRRRHTRSKRDWSSDVCSSDLKSSSFTKLNFSHTRFKFSVVNTSFKGKPNSLIPFSTSVFPFSIFSSLRCLLKNCLILLFACDDFVIFNQSCDGP